MTDNLTPERIAEAQERLIENWYEIGFDGYLMPNHLKTIRDALAYVEAHKLKETRE